MISTPPGPKRVISYRRKHTPVFEREIAEVPYVELHTARQNLSSPRHSVGDFEERAVASMETPEYLVDFVHTKLPMQKSFVVLPEKVLADEL